MAALFTAHESRALLRARRLLERALRDPAAPVFDRVEMTREYLKARFAGLDHEQIHALFLDTQHTLIAAEIVSIGSIAQADLYPRELARTALRLNASAIILAHNHPSGSTTPSAADRHLTVAARVALSYIDVRLLDHVVVAGDQIVSAAERGLL